jgi:ABC-type branched-subunit amino acid transport system permease subunit
VVAPAYAENWMILFGPILIMVVMFGRGGLVGLLDRWWAADKAGRSVR